VSKRGGVAIGIGIEKMQPCKGDINYSSTTVSSKAHIKHAKAWTPNLQEEIESPETIQFAVGRSAFNLFCNKKTLEYRL